MIVPVDTIVTFEDGAYSDFTYAGPYRVTKEFDPADVVAKLRAEFKPRHQYDQLGVPHLIEFLKQHGHIQFVTSLRWSCGAYDFDPEIDIELDSE